jgi:hypothetical protein
MDGSRTGEEGKWEGGGLTLCSGGMLVQQTTTPLKGTDGSKRSAAPGGESGGEAMVPAVL